MNINEIQGVSGIQGQGSTQGAQTSVVQSQPVIKQVENINTDSSAKDANESLEQKEKSGAAAMSTIKEAVGKINKQTSSCEAKFGIHEGTNRVTIKMVDKKTKEVVKEFPADETLDLIAKAWELAGIMVDEKR